MKYVVKMGSGAMVYTPSSMKIGSGIEKLLGGTHTDTQTHRQQGDPRNILLFFQNKEIGL
jgi:hypothetical protein